MYLSGIPNFSKLTANMDLYGNTFGFINPNGIIEGYLQSNPMSMPNLLNQQLLKMLNPKTSDKAWSEAIDYIMPAPFPTAETIPNIWPGLQQVTQQANQLLPSIFAIKTNPINTQQQQNPFAISYSNTQSTNVTTEEKFVPTAFQEIEEEEKQKQQTEKNKGAGVVVESVQMYIDPGNPDYVIPYQKEVTSKESLRAKKAIPYLDISDISYAPVNNTNLNDDAHELVRKYANQYQLPERLILAMIEQESSNINGKTSPKGAQGYMQLMPQTAKSLGVTNPMDPEQNIEAGTRYMRYLIDKYQGDVNIALAAYNAGEGRVNTYKGIPPFGETREYVANINHKLKANS